VEGIAVTAVASVVDFETAFPQLLKYNDDQPDIGGVFWRADANGLCKAKITLYRNA
jgi:hypothetical protein